MDQALFVRILDVAGFLGTVVLPLFGFMFWMKSAFLVTGAGGFWFSVPLRMKVLLLVLLLSPVLSGWLIAKVMAN